MSSPSITKATPSKSYFIMELPEYRVPSLKRAAVSMLARGKAFVVNAGTVILLCNVTVQLMQTFTWNFQVVETGMENTSILASLASPLAFLLIPLGFGVWQLAAAAVVGFIAKENVVVVVSKCRCECAQRIAASGLYDLFHKSCLL